MYGETVLYRESHRDRDRVVGTEWEQGLEFELNDYRWNWKKINLILYIRIGAGVGIN